MFPQKHVVYIYFLCFLVLSIREFGSSVFPFVVLATGLTFINYLARFRWQELLPGTAAVLSALALVSLLKAGAPHLPPKVVWIYDYSNGRKTAVLEGWKFVKLKDKEPSVGDYAYNNGESFVKNDSLSGFLERERYYLYRKLEERIDYPISALVGATTLGIRFELPAALKSYFSLAGVYHFLAISGLHVGIVIGAIAFLLKLAKVPKPLTLASLALLPLLPLTGLPPSAVRAYLFTLLIGLGLESYRKITPLYLLGVVMLLTLIFGEFNLSAALSFSAVGGILVAVETEKRRVLQFLKASVAPILSTAPIVLSVFGTINLLSWLTTLLLGFIFSPFLISAFLEQISLGKIPLIDSITQTLGTLFIKGVQEAFLLSRFSIVHSELPIYLTAGALLVSLALILFKEGKFFLLPLLALVTFGALFQTVEKGKSFYVKGWELNSFRFLSTKGQRYINCQILSDYVFPVTRKFLYKNQLIDKRLTVKK